jgi:hypothetical protein
MVWYLHLGLTASISMFLSFLWCFYHLLKIGIMTVKMVLLLLNFNVSVSKLDVCYGTMKTFSVKFLNN